MLGDAHLVQGQAAVGVDAVGQGGAHGVGLLVNLLLHEGRPPVLGGAIRGEVDLVRLALDGVTRGVDDGHAGRRDDHDLVLVDLDGAVRVLDEGQDVGAQEVLPIPQADDQRGGAAGRDDNVRGLGAEHQQGEGAVQLGGDSAHGDDQSARHFLVRAGQSGDRALVRGRLGLIVGAGQQVDDHLGVGLRGEGLAVGDEGGTQGVRVLNDAVVDEGEAPVRAGMGVGVRDRRATVGRPAGVSDARKRVGRRLRVELFGEVDKLAERATHVQVIRGRQGDTRRVVPAIFEARQAAEDNLATTLGRLACNMSNNSAHSTHCNTSNPPTGQ